MTTELLQFADHAPGRPYHAAFVVQPFRSQASEPHGHADFFEFMAVVSGHGRHLLPDCSQELRAGDVALARPHDRHALQGLAPVGMHFVNVAFPAALWRGFVDLAGFEAAEEWNESAAPPHWRLADRADRTAERAAEIFQRALTRYHPRPAMLDAMRFWTDLAELLGDADGRGTDPGAAGRPAWLTAVCTAMRQEENLRAGVPAMLRLAGVSPAHLSRSMRTHHQTTPTAFVTELRLQRAAELLTATSEPVTAVAQQCGFASQSYFTRCFRTVHGIPPREYRRRAWEAFVPRNSGPAERQS
ncbi:AraC family transcriptional regulator [Streptomyces armeniacus]|uniref:AraC family transcriptional regulator n=1 Tax=Streptomyces armeniacus TaxID=83291 RepID=A0A345XTN8_9ACTN|nr:AraC family transcriptional regulator [Streptomyces armeniacus]AXK35004.1 AraC family transcriptional regulator [Streptomyces armeniacus]